MSIGQHDKKGFAEIRRESLSIYNRIHSIAEDALFVEKVVEQYSEYPVIPNLRCGAWYVRPDLADGRFAYFKSTDGHFNNWSFNLRRPNVHLLPIIAENPGVILVDSTRAGKRMPDALSKSIPIWCAVVNKAIAKKFPSGFPQECDINLFTPPASVSRQEHHQIEKHIDEWAEGLAVSEYTLPLLPKPLRPIWVDPSTAVLPSFSGSQAFIPLVCLSASKKIAEGLERRSKGFTYVQGSGDDHELWGRGLTPDLFWSFRSTLLNTLKSDLESVIDGLVDSQALKEGRPTEFHGSSTPKPIHAVQGRLLSVAISELPDPPPSLSPAAFDGLPRRLAYVLIAPHRPREHPIEGCAGDLASQNILRMSLPASVSTHSNFLFYNILPRATQFIGKRLSIGEDVCVACPTGSDLGPGVIVAALALFFGDNGVELSSDVGTEAPTINKSAVRKRLQWIISSNPKINPSRNTLKRVNEFLMSHYHPLHAHPRSTSTSQTTF